MNQSILPLCGLVLIASASVCAQIPERRSSAITAGEARPEHRSNAASQMRHTMRDEVNAGLVGIISAGMEGTELEETTDLAASLDGARDHLRILPIAGKGAFQNATDIVFARGVDIGVIQSDVLAALKREPPFAGIENYLRYITKLYDEELHVLAGTQVRSVEDLASQKVNFSTRDSGTFVTATAIFDGLGITVEATNFPQPVALEKLRQGEIAALVYLAGKPARLFQTVRPDENLHFLSIRATAKLPESYTSATLTAEDYPELIEANAPISTVAMGTVLAVYNWPAETERYRKVASFVQAFFDRLHDMQSPAHHPKWREINLTNRVGAGLDTVPPCGGMDQTGRVEWRGTNLWLASARGDHRREHGCFERAGARRNLQRVCRLSEAMDAACIRQSRSIRSATARCPLPGVRRISEAVQPRRFCRAAPSGPVIRAVRRLPGIGTVTRDRKQSSFFGQTGSS